MRERERERAKYIQHEQENLPNNFSNGNLKLLIDNNIKNKLEIITCPFSDFLQIDSINLQGRRQKIIVQESE